MKYKKELGIASIWLILVVIVFGYVFIQNLSIFEGILELYNFIRENIFIGALIFIIAFIIRPLIFIPVTPFEFIAGATFGIYLGTFLCVIAYGLSALFSSTVGKYTGGVFFDDLSKFTKIQKIRSKIKHDTFSTIVIMRLLFFPVDLTNYLCGVLKIPKVPHALGVMVGGFPGIFVFVLAGASFYGQEITSLSQLQKNINYQYLFFAIGLFLLSIIISKILKKKYKF